MRENLASTRRKTLSSLCLEEPLTWSNLAQLCHLCRELQA